MRPRPPRVVGERAGGREPAPPAARAARNPDRGRGPTPNSTSARNRAGSLRPGAAARRAGASMTAQVRRAGQVSQRRDRARWRETDDGRPSGARRRVIQRVSGTGATMDTRRYGRGAHDRRRLRPAKSTHSEQPAPARSADRRGDPPGRRDRAARQRPCRRGWRFASIDLAEPAQGELAARPAAGTPAGDGRSAGTRRRPGLPGAWCRSTERTRRHVLGAPARRAAQHDRRRVPRVRRGAAPPPGA